MDRKTGAQAQRSKGQWPRAHGPGAHKGRADAPHGMKSRAGAGESSFHARHEAGFPKDGKPGGRGCRLERQNRQDAGLASRDGGVSCELGALKELFPESLVLPSARGGKGIRGERAHASSFAGGFELLRNALKAVMPLKRAHERELPRNIVALSRLLTVDRSELRRPYWAKAPLAGAYLHYYLPWNVYRLYRLISGLDLRLPKVEKGFVLDLGSGPLSLPIALWLARPDLRERKIRVLATDCAGHPLQLGKRVLEHMAQAAGVAPWDIRTVQAPILQGLKEARAQMAKGFSPLLVSAANVLNELPFPRKARFEDEEDEGPENFSRLGEVASAMAQVVRRGGGARLLLVEPGTRLGGLALMRMRGFLAEEGLEIAAPCPHQGPCPLLEDEEPDFDEEMALEGDEDMSARQGSLAGKTWCHCVFSSHGAPDWLVELSRAAGFAKERLSLAFVEAAAPKKDAGKEETGRDKDPKRDRGHEAVQARIISGPFVVPGSRLSCRYACSDRGLLLLQNAAALSAGSLASLSVEGLENAPRDRKSGACVLHVHQGRRQGFQESRGRPPKGFDRKDLGKTPGRTAGKTVHAGFGRESCRETGKGQGKRPGGLGKSRA